MGASPTQPTSSSILNYLKSDACWEVGWSLYRAIPERRSRKVRIDVVRLPRVEVRLAVVAVPVEVGHLGEAIATRKALLTICLHQIQTHPNLEFYMRWWLSPAKSTEYSIVARSLFVFVNTKTQSVARYQTRWCISMNIHSITIVLKKYSKWKSPQRLFSKWRGLVQHRKD